MRLFLMIGLLVVGLIAFITTHNIWYFIVPAFIYAITMFRPKKNSASVATEKTEIKEEEKNLWEGYDQAFSHSTSSPSLEVEEEDYVFEDKEDTEDDLFDDVEDDFGLDDTLFDDIDSELSELDKELEEEVFSPAQLVAATTEEKVETPISDDVLDELLYQPETEEKQTMDEFDELFFKEDVSDSPSTVVEVEEDPDLLPEEEWGLQDSDDDDIDLFIPEGFVEEEKGDKGLEEIKQKALAELDQLVGMEQLKKDIQKKVNFFASEKEKEKNGFPTEPITLHMIFKGDAGTGKTTVARIIADLLKGLGILESGHYIEADRGSLVGNYVGQTATKTKELIQQAMGGVLFIDEIYSLASGGPQDFGIEAINTLLTELENNRSNFVCIGAGYSEHIADFFATNQGLKSRFPNQFDFPNYTVDELMILAEMSLNKLKLELTPEAKKALFSLLEADFNEHGYVEGNGRTVRNIIQVIRENQGDRLTRTKSTDYMTIESDDIPSEIITR